MNRFPSILGATLLTFTTVACAGPAGVASVPRFTAPLPCPAPGARWGVPTAGKRIVRVALAADASTTDGWEYHRAERLRSATESWNLLDLPLRLVPTDDVTQADVRVFVVRSIPANAGSYPELARYQAGLTRLTRDSSGTIVRAHVAVAERSPTGESYRLDEQVATLLHELGHALGLPHTPTAWALMAARPVVSSITRVDVRMARDVYRGSACAVPAVASR